MRTHSIQFHDKISLNICFLELSEEFRRISKNEFESDMVNEPPVFELLKFAPKEDLDIDKRLVLEFNDPVNTIRVLSSRSVYLTTLFPRQTKSS